MLSWCCHVFQGEVAHRFIKRLYSRTNKNNAVKQIAKNERRSTRLRRAREAAAAPRVRHAHHVPFAESDPVPHSSIDHHQMSDSKNFSHHLMTFISEPAGDPAKIVGLFHWHKPFEIHTLFAVELYSETQKPFTGPTAESTFRRR